MPVSGIRNIQRWLLVFALAATVASEAATAPTETDVSKLELERDEFTDEFTDATLWLYADTADDDRDWLLWRCHDAESRFDDMPYVMVQASGVRTAHRQAESDTERVRFRVDREPMRQFESVGVIDWTEARHGFTGTGTANMECPLEFLQELASGQRLIAQIGSLSVLSFDLAAARPDIVKFENACERLYDDRP